MSCNMRDHSEAILITHDAIGRNWQLGVLPPPKGEFALIGWTQSAKDGGVPSTVADALARGLTRFGRVTFLSSSLKARPGSQWKPQGPDYVGSFLFAVGRGWQTAIPLRLRRTELPLLSTTREEVVCSLFDDAGYPWWLQGQFVLLSPLVATPPKLDTHQLLPAELLGDEWSSCLSDLTEAGVDALMRPGVDGDVVGLVSRSPAAHRRVIENIRRAAADFSLDCHILPEDAFIKLLSAGRSAGRHHPGKPNVRWPRMP